MSMSTSVSTGAGTLSYAAPAERVGFWRAPFAAVTYREFGYILASLPIAVVGFAFALTMFSVGAVLAVTVLGLPVLAGLLAGARGLGGAERRRAAEKLGLAAGAPASVPTPRAAGFWAGQRARLGDAAGWRAFLFQLVMFPWRMVNFVLSTAVLLVGWAVALLPAYNWVFPHYVGWPGYRLFDFTSGGVHHQYYLTSPFQLAGVSLVGLVIVFLTPKLIRALTNVDRAAVRGMLG
ncbi:sensor domain-containing protein [Streptomyces sp. NPDC050610]|uniref:sensor domain-containing protein n=1 Tax=Streptomyces sp. NPDC050610 TaxID=3157097 RepID=UPI00341F8464